MKLRHQLFLISLLTLLVPWAGYLFIQELEQTLRQNQLTNLSQHAKLIAEQLEKSSIKLPAKPTKGYRPLYALKLPAPIILDGYFDDWRAASDKLIPLASTNSDLSITYQTGVRGKRFYLFINASTSQTSYRDPSKGELDNSDHLLLKLASPAGQVIDIVASPIAPGPIDLLSRSYSGKFVKDPALRGYWQDTRKGFQVELEIPLSRVQHGVGFSIIKKPSGKHPDSMIQSAWSGVTPPEEQRILPPVIYRLAELESLITPYRRDYTRISLVDRDHWVIAKIGQTNEESYSAPWQDGEYDSLVREILLTLFKAVLGQQKPIESEQSKLTGQRNNRAIQQALNSQPATEWFHDPASNQAIIAAAHPVSLHHNNQDHINQGSPQPQGVILVEQTTDAIASLSDSAMVKLIAISFSVVLLIVLVLLGFSSLLSWRVARLRNQIDSSISEDGRIRHEFKASVARDELGDLSRSFSAMHQEVTHYTEYLENFSRKLSHELKTPLAIVRSSIENLSINEQLFVQDNIEEVRTYLQRADGGAKRLSQIIQSMSEASRLEKSIASTDKEQFDLTDVVISTGEAFKSLLTAHNVSIEASADSRLVSGAPELIAQLMDKLIENAKDFTPEGACIKISLKNSSRDYILSVCNEGPPLPEKMQREIFSSFISLRDNTQEEGHMGQGLVIVKLITDYHGGSVRAYNIKDHPPFEGKQGVCFEVRLPFAKNAVAKSPATKKTQKGR